MSIRARRLKYRELALLAAFTVAVLALGWITARDLRRSADDADRLYQRLSRSVDVIDHLQFATQEVRRILLYPLHTSDANLQLEYAEKSRAAGVEVLVLLERADAIVDMPRGKQSVTRIRQAWDRYLLIRDEVIGLILEGSLPDAVALDERDGTNRFNEVRAGIAELKEAFAHDAAVQVDAARARATAATRRLTLLVVVALIAAALGISLVNRRSALESLLRIEAHKGSILQAVPDPILSTDADGRIVELNQAAEQVFGISRAAVIGRLVEDVILPPAEHGVVAAVLAGARGASRVVWPRLTTTARNQDGSEFPVEIAAVSHEARGERVWTLHVADLTDRRRTEEQLRRAKEAAEAADRAKSDFLATISHELRTPLVGVIGVADLLQDAGATPAQADLLAMLRSSASALLGLISDILDYSRIEAGLLDLKPLAFSVRECIEDAFDAVTELAARKGLDLGYVLLGDVPERVIADQARVRQVLLNLLSNAVKFTDSGEVSVVVSAEATESGELRMRACVNDTGLGIPEHLHDRLFQRFSQIQTGRVKHAGAGLGLAISERLSRLLGGSLSVQSTVNEGSTFTFLFRADADPTLAEAVVADRPLEGRRVLVLGQATIVSRQLHCILQEWGAHVRVASSPDALESAERWDVVIADADRFGGGAMAVVGTLLKVIAPARLLLVSRNRSLAPGDTVGSPILNKPVKAAALRAALESAGIVLRAEAAAVDTVPRAPFAADVLSILLVEDNDANRRVLEAMIRELGLRADVAAGGREAVEATKLTAYDVILMDLQMPDLDGLEATRRIRRLRPDGGGPTIIALTADAVRGEQARWRDAGMDGYLAKPLRLETLAATLLPLVGRKPASN